MSDSSRPKKRTTLKRLGALCLFCLLGASISRSSFAAASNDNLASAFDLGAVATFTVSGDTTGAGTENGETGINGRGQTIWYKWTAPASAQVQLNTQNSAVNRTFRLGVFTSSTPGSPTFASLTSTAPSANNAVQFAAVANTAYFICVDTTNGGQPGGVNLNLFAAPANDNFANAVDLGNTNSFAVAGDNTGATKEAGEAMGTFTVWYKWTAPASSVVRMNTFGSKTNHNLRIFSAAAPPAVATLVFLGNSQITTTAGTTYFMSVDSGTAAIGPFLLNLTANPSNDFFAGIADLQNQAAFKVSGDDSGATTEAGEPPDGAGSGGTLWYKWTAPFTRRIQFDTFGSTAVNGARIDLFTGTQLNSLTSVTSNANFAALNAVSGTTYLIRTDGTAGNFGLINLNLPSQPNDLFANATPISGDSLSGIQGDTTNATKEPNEPNHGNDPGGASVWYSWTATSTGPVTITQTSVATFGFNQVSHSLAVYTGASVGTLALAAPGSQAAPALNNNVNFTAVAGSVYKIAVDGQGGAFGAFVLSLSVVPAPANDNFANSIALTGASVSILGVNLGATLEPNEPTSVGSGSTVWYKWTAPSTGNFVITTGNFASILDIYTGTAVNGLTAAATGATTATLLATANTQYQIRVDSASQGGFNLSILPAPPNDNFASSIVVSGATFDVFGYNFGATLEAGEPIFGGSNTVWWSWTAPANAHVAVSINGSGPSIDGVRVYTGAAVNALTPVLVNLNSSTNITSQFDAIQGTVYRFQVESFAGDNIELSLNAAPSNDNFANSIALSGTLAQINGNNYAATKESGEPAHNGNPGGQSVWYSWTAPSAGKVNINVNSNGTFNPVLAVYTGTAVNALTEASSGTTAVSFVAVAGIVYRIAIDGTSAGTFSLSLREAPPNDNFSNAILLTGYTSTTGSNNLATKEPGEPAHGGNPGGKSVWWTWVAPDSRLVEVVTTGSSFDTLLGVYTGSAVTALTGVAGNDNEGINISTSKVQFNSVAGTTYQIAVDGFNNGGGAVNGSIVLTIRRADVKITSPLAVSPDPQVAGKPLTFTVGTDAPATFTWDFGDGTKEVNTSSTITHVFAVAGSYTVTVTVSEDNGFSVSSSLAITVLASKDLGVAKLAITLDFTKPAHDTIGGSGFLTLPPAGSLSGPLILRVGGVSQNLTLLAGVSPKSKTTAFKLSAPKVTGPSKYTFKLTGSFQAALGAEFTKSIVKNKAIDVPVQFIFDGVSYEFKITVSYTSTGKKGSAK